MTKIEWTDTTWNPIAGCTVLSPACTNCYAMRMASRLEAMGIEKYKGLTRKSGGRATWTGETRLDVKVLEEPYKWRKPRRVFVNSMSDLFHESISEDTIIDVMTVIEKTPQHTYQILTKRPERFDVVSSFFGWPKNVWLGVSVESADYLTRVELLRKTLARVKFLSLEPLLGPLEDLNLEGIDWVIVGGESGPGARPMHPDWVRSIRDQCVGADVPFFFKQWGSWVPFYDRDKDDPDWRNVPCFKSPNERWINIVGGQGFHNDRVVAVRRSSKKSAGRMLDGQTWDEFPNE